MPENKIKMTDISSKEETNRTAVAGGFIKLSKETLVLIKSGQIPKGDVIRLSEAAAVSAVKMTPSIVPLCHPVRITGCRADINPEKGGIRVEVEVKAFDRTGVEMEALTAASAALLNIYDMVKPIDRSASIKEIKLIKKTGGKSGDYERES